MTGPDTKDNDTGNSKNVQINVAKNEAKTIGLDSSSKAAGKGKVAEVKDTNAKASCAGMI